MAHFAQLDNQNRVVQVIVVNNSDLLDAGGVERESIGIAFCQNLLGENTTWVQTSYNGSFRKNYAGLGYTYDSARDAFISPCPYPSWSLNEDTCKWEPPVVRPADGDYIWNEQEQQWDSVE